MSRRTAGSIGPLLFTLAALVLTSQVAAATDLPSASGDTPYTQVSNEEPVKPGTGQTGKTILPAVDVSAAKPSTSEKPSNSAKPATITESNSATEKGKAAAHELRTTNHKPPATDETDPATIGHPLAPGLIEILQEEIIARFAIAASSTILPASNATPDISSTRRPRPTPAPSWRATAGSPGTTTCSATP